MWLSRQYCNCERANNVKLECNAWFHVTCVHMFMAMTGLAIKVTVKMSITREMFAWRRQELRYCSWWWWCWWWWWSGYGSEGEEVEKEEDDKHELTKACALVTASPGMVLYAILFRGIIVQRRLSWPLSSNFWLVFSVSTTTLYSCSKKTGRRLTITLLNSSSSHLDTRYLASCGDLQPCGGGRILDFHQLRHQALDLPCAK